MKQIFAIFGYGVPKNIFDDGNYSRYLSAVFNHIYDLANGGEAVVFFTGGKTDCFKQYMRTEALEMKKLFKSLADLPAVKKKTNGWKYITESKSISGLENILYTAGYLKKNNITSGTVHVFCEYTRKKRIEKIFRYGNMHNGHLKHIKFNVIGVDFDLSSNRYLDKEFIERKEKMVLKQEMNAIKSKKNLDAYIKWHKEKLKFFRENDYVNNPDVVRMWWENNLIKK